MTQSWGQLEAAKAQVQATQAQVNSAEIALNGVREEARVGQRTTLDVLKYPARLVNARVALVTAWRPGGRVLLAARRSGRPVGRRPRPQDLGVRSNDALSAVRDSWAGGVRNPDGR